MRTYALGHKPVPVLLRDYALIDSGRKHVPAVAGRPIRNRQPCTVAGDKAAGQDEHNGATGRARYLVACAALVSRVLRRPFLLCAKTKQFDDGLVFSLRELLYGTASGLSHDPFGQP